MLNTAQHKRLSYLYGIQKVAAVRPQEASHLAQKIFEKGDLNLRLATFRAILFSAYMGDGKMIGDLFVKLMAATTQEEREDWVEPFMESLLKYSTHKISTNVQRKLSWLHAYYHGWREEREIIA